MLSAFGMRILPIQLGHKSRDNSPACWVDLILNRLERIYFTLNEEKPLKNRGVILKWWRRRELHIYYKLLINIDLMSLQIRFCYILCYLKYSILMPRVKMYTSFMAHQKNSQK